MIQHIALWCAAVSLVCSLVNVTWQAITDPDPVSRAVAIALMGFSAFSYYGVAAVLGWVS